MSRVAALADVGSRLDDPTFWAFAAFVVGVIAGAILRSIFLNAKYERIEEENKQLRLSLIEAYQAIADPKGANRKIAANVRRALRDTTPGSDRQPYDWRREGL